MTLYTALVTPFDAEGALDDEGLRKNIRFQVERGVDGVTALGTTGEAPTLTEKEKRTLLQIAAEECSNVMAGVTHNSTLQTIKNAEMAKECGASSLLIAPPYYNKPTQEGLFRHFSEVAAAVRLPIYLYNHPFRTGVSLEIETVVRLAAIPGIVGIKEASGEIGRIGDLIAALPGFRILSGDDPITLPLMALGGHGAVSVIGNLFPEEMGALVRSPITEARIHHFRLLPLMKALNLETNPIPVKEAMNLAGRAAGKPRLPLTPLSENHREKLERLIHVQTQSAV